ncbi:MAG: dihydropteroate synthase [Oscillospiraceae bacterium]|nr:dihydropteroate synthase [Oscillospiraceae bacterium]
MIIGNREFSTKDKCYIMGILNLTPDSFSDGGKWMEIDDALSHVDKMVSEGADIIDIGGESTRPGYRSISEAEEIERVVPIIEAVKERFNIPISIDTYKSRVAEAALSAGADMINDIWGLKRDPRMAPLIAKSGVACCLMQNRVEIDYRDFIPDLLDDLKESVQIALHANIAKDKIILDPGVGFAFSHEMNLMAINKLDMIKKLGYPVLLGASRKSVIGKVLDSHVSDRLEGTLATTVIAVMRGCTFVRVHDVRESKRVIMMTEAIIYS